jgi:hypothetical protein
MNRNLSLVSPLCGPGFTAFWILTYASLLLTWTLHRRKARQDQMNIVLVIALIFPTVVGLEEAYLVYSYPGDRVNLTSWRARRLHAANQAIFNDHTATRTNLLVLFAILAPLCALRLHVKRLGLLMAPLGPLLFGHFATEAFLPHVGEILWPLPSDARGSIMWVRFFPTVTSVVGLEAVVLILFWHLFFLVPRALWRWYRGSGLGYLETVLWDAPPGWRGYLYAVRNLVVQRRPWMDRLDAAIGGVLIPSVVIWFLVPTIAADYRANLKSIRGKHGLGDKLAAFRLTLLPRSQSSIWNWQQMSLLALGLVASICAASDIWAERKTSGLIAADLDVKNLESDTKRDC